MADYSFECKKCGNQFTATMTIAEKDKNPHPECAKCKSKDTFQIFTRLNMVSDISTPLPPPSPPPGGMDGMGGMGGMGMPPMCGPGMGCGF